MTKRCLSFNRKGLRLFPASLVLFLKSTVSRWPETPESCRTGCPGRFAQVWASSQIWSGGAGTPLEPVIAAIMQRCHIVDMTIADPPMEEIIADIYGQKSATEQAGAKFVAPETASSSTNGGG